MTRAHLFAAIALATGESLRTIDRIGFREKRGSREEEPTRDDPVAVIDCPCCGGTVVLAWNRKDALPDFADCRRCETVFPYATSEVYETDLLDVSVAEPLNAPQSMHAVGDGSILRNFNDAVACAALDSVRFATNKIQLRGRAKEIVGTDGRQLLIIRGNDFPWSEDLLVPRPKLFDAKRFIEATTVEMARTDKHVVVRVGLWTVWLTGDTTSRYPDFIRIIPHDNGDDTKLLLDRTDSEFLAHALPKLPCNEECRSVTLHLNGQVVVRAQAESAPVTELVLSKSRTVGDEIRINTDREYLRRAAEIGVAEIRIRNDTTPIVAESDSRTYVWQPLPSKITLGPMGPGGTGGPAHRPRDAFVLVDLDIPGLLAPLDVSLCRRPS